jgi:galactokinase
VRSFLEVFGHEPEGSWAAPGRVNLIGEHTDYNGGRALPMAIDRRCVVQARRRSDQRVRVWSRQQEEVLEADLDGRRSGQWVDYVAGTAWALREQGHPVGGADLLVDSDVPLGAGLSSSAALECAAALAVAGVHGVALTSQQVIDAAHRAEVEVVGAPVGLLDQTASVLAQPEHGLLLDFGDGTVTPVPLGLATAGLEVLVMDTRVEHAHATGGYAQRRSECDAAGAALGVSSLSAVTPDQLAAPGLDDTLRRRARHVVTENARVLACADAFRAGDHRRAGALMLASHLSLRDDFEVSTPELDLVVDAAMAAGALGARLTGGGFGGSAIALVRMQDSARVTEAVGAAASAFQPRVFPVRAGGAAGRIRPPRGLAPTSDAAYTSTTDSLYT